MNFIDRTALSFPINLFNQVFHIEETYNKSISYKYKCDLDFSIFLNNSRQPKRKNNYSIPVGNSFINIQINRMNHRIIID
jgi:hypothetical protein